MKNAIVKTIFVCMVFFGVCWSQVPSLNPDQTVNPASGEMTLSIPLGGIPGAGRLGYSANLNYHAGITTGEEASAAGLGFGYEPGCVYRKVVYV
jgi:hypothetical protein